MSSFEFLSARLDALTPPDRRRRLVPQAADGVWLEQPDGRRLLNFGSNDYLGLAADPDRSSQKTELRSGSGASALVCGWTPAHQLLCDKIASWESTEAAVLFPSGFAACSGTVATLAGKEDLVLSDQLNHASLIDGCRLSPATRIVYPHRDCAAVEQTLATRRGEFSTVWIVTDSVFSMDGHVAPLRDLSTLAARYDAHLIVDEAHASGVLGANGSGLCEELGLKEPIAIRIGTLSKAIGSQGGFVAAPRSVTDYLVNRCRSLIFSTALAPACVSAASEGISRIAAEPARRQRVRRLSRRLRKRLRIVTSETLESEVPIIPVMVGEDAAAVAISARLAEAGYYVPAIRPPTVPEGTSRLRVSLSTAHDEPMVDRLADAILELTHGRASQVRSTPSHRNQENAGF